MIRQLRITMRESVKAGRRQYTQGVTYTSRDVPERKLFRELVLNDLADEADKDETANGAAVNI